VNHHHHQVIYRSVEDEQ